MVTEVLQRTERRPGAQQALAAGRCARQRARRSDDQRPVFVIRTRPLICLYTCHGGSGAFQCKHALDSAEWRAGNPSRRTEAACCCTQSARTVACRPRKQRAYDVVLCDCTCVSVARREVRAFDASEQSNFAHLRAVQTPARLLGIDCSKHVVACCAAALCVVWTLPECRSTAADVTQPTQRQTDGKRLAQRPLAAACGASSSKQV